MINTINDGKIAILESLARYKFLTTSQFIALGIYKSKNRLRESINSLYSMHPPLVGRMIYPVQRDGGRIDNMHYLTENGVNFLIDELEYFEDEINYPKNKKPLITRDYIHRVNTIYFQIYFMKWLEKKGYDLKFYYCYYDMEGANNTQDKNNQRLKSKIKFEIDEKCYITPDSAFLFNENNKQYFFLFEMQNGFDTGNTLRKIQLHQKLIASGKASDKLRIKKDNRVLFVFQIDEQKQAVLKRLNSLERIERYNEHFLFKSMDEVYYNFFSGWTKPNGGKTDLI